MASSQTVLIQRQPAINHKILITHKQMKERMTKLNHKIWKSKYKYLWHLEIYVKQNNESNKQKRGRTKYCNIWKGNSNIRKKRTKILKKIKKNWHASQKIHCRRHKKHTEYSKSSLLKKGWHELQKRSWLNFLIYLLSHQKIRDTHHKKNSKNQTNNTL